MHSTSADCILSCFRSKFTRGGSLILAFVALAGCRPMRSALGTLNGNPTDARPAMTALAPAALTLIGDLRGPESALHDPEQDVYFISNLNGGLLTADNNGFITRVDAKSMAVNLKWIEGGVNGVTLHAPKGMAVLGDTLYVSDIGGVRKFDRRTGAPRVLIALTGSTLVNDITTDGRSLYVSDTGIRPAPGTTFFETGTDAVWKITDDRAEKIAASTELDHPNGLDWIDGRLWVVTFRGNHLYQLDGGKIRRAVELPKGQLDGLVHLADGSVLVSSWLGNEIYRGKTGGPFHAILAGLAAPADIGYDATHRRLLVPNSPMNQVTIHAVQ
jgi:hypothetical protein